MDGSSDARTSPGEDPVSPPDLSPDAPLRRFCGYHVKRTFSLFHADLNATLKPLGLRMSSFSVLSLIAAHDGIRQSQLADALMIERPNLVQLIDELEAAGWISRDRDPQDRRAWRLTGTGEGRTLYRRASAAVADHEDRLLAGLSEAERDQLVALLRRVETTAAPSPAAAT